MEKNRIDLSPYLLSGEKIISKSHALKSKSVYVETGLCLLFWFLTVAGDCFMVGYANYIRTMSDTSWFLPFFIALVVVHLVPLAMWVVSLSAKSTANSEKWFVLTDRRVICISGGATAVLSFIKLTDVVSVKTSKKYVLITLSQGRYFKISGISDAAAFSAALEAELDKLFDSHTLSDEQEEQYGQEETCGKSGEDSVVIQAENSDTAHDGENN